VRPWSWKEWEEIPERFAEEIVYVTRIRNEVEARRNGSTITSYEDSEPDMEGDLAGMSEVSNG
jgi:hypothetical protein|tara:strand:+ start:840 stop:1028 length:189 start_codon:yes stop_codon:yes gene_type:complete